MAINVQSFSELTQSQVDAAYSLIVQMVQENDPTIDTKRGVIADLVLHLSSVLSAANQANIDKVRRSNSLLAINADPTLADDDIVDRVASNYLTTRKAGSTASGQVAIVLNAAKSVLIPQGSQFTDANGLLYTADAGYASRLTADTVVAATDRLLIQVGTSTWIFIISVTSSDVGSKYKLLRNASLVVPPIDPAILRAYVAADFVGGTDAETNAELLVRLQAGVSSKSLANRVSVDGLVRSLELSMFDSSLSTSVVGFGDTEMQRYHSVLPVAFGGRMDLYVRTQATAQSVQLTKTATYVGPNSSNQGIWQISINRDEAPGFYEVSRITQLANITNSAFASYSLLTDARNYDLSVGTSAGTTVFPDIAKAVEAVYSRYQTASITFTDTDTSTLGLVAGTSTGSYGVIVTQMPGIASVQDAVSDRTTCYPIGDYPLVKAPVPCFVTVQVNLSKHAADTIPSTSAVQAAVASAANAVKFTGRLPVGPIVTAVHGVTTGTVAVDSIVLTGRVRKPNGSIVNITSTSVLDVSTLDAANMASAKTIAFLLNAADVTVVTSSLD